MKELPVCHLLLLISCPMVAVVPGFASWTCTWNVVQFHCLVRLFLELSMRLNQMSCWSGGSNHTQVLDGSFYALEFFSICACCLHMQVTRLVAMVILLRYTFIPYGMLFFFPSLPKKWQWSRTSYQSLPLVSRNCWHWSFSQPLYFELIDLSLAGSSPITLSTCSPWQLFLNLWICCRYLSKTAQICVVSYQNKLVGADN